MSFDLQTLLILLLGMIAGNLASIRFSGKYEGDQSRMKSIIIPLGKDKIIWVHHWIFYSVNLIVMLIANANADSIWRIGTWFIGFLLMLLLFVLSRLIFSLKHLALLTIVSSISLTSLFIPILFGFVIGSFIGIILHGLSYKDRFEIVKSS